jgi:PBP1b-binding outer membrane lipoprotein LpoB
MKSIVVAVTIAAFALVGCTSSTADPTPTVTITEQAPAPNLNTDDGTVSNSERFIQFVRDNGGSYGRAASESSIFELGDTICNAFNKGLSEDEVTYALAQSLVNNGMNNEDGARFAASLLVGARNFLCGAPGF